MSENKSSRSDDPYFIKELKARINLKPNQFKKLEENIYINLKDKVEGKNQNCGYINPNSIVITKRSNGYFRGSHLTGEMTFDINYIAEICYPMKGDEISAEISNINEAGLIAIKGPLILFAPKEYQENYTFFESGISLGSIVKFRVIDSKSQLYDNTIDVICSIVDIIEPNMYVQNENNRVYLNCTEIEDLEKKNVSNLNTSFFGYDTSFDKIQNFYNKLDNENLELIKSYVNKYELVLPNISYHEALTTYNNNISYFELIELNNYYDLINPLNKDKMESYIVFNDIDNSFINSILFCRGIDDTSDIFSDMFLSLSESVSSKKSNNIIREKIELGSDNSLKTVKTFVDKYKKVQGIVYNQILRDPIHLLKLLKYCINSLIPNGNVIIKTSFIYDSFSYKVASYFSSFFHEFHYVRPECSKDYDDTCYFVFKFFKEPSSKDEKILEDLLDNVDFNDIKGINIDKNNLKEILNFNNRNSKQIYFKTIAKINNFVINPPSDEDIQKMQNIQKQDAQKWISYFGL
jgi:DNA-directed RNA polymerase subunit E'/Rpb7